MLIATSGNSMVCQAGGSDEVGSTYWNCYSCDKAGGCFNLFAKADFTMPSKMKKHLKQELAKFKHRKGCPAKRSTSVTLVRR